MRFATFLVSLPPLGTSVKTKPFSWIAICPHGHPATTENGAMKKLRPDGTITCSDSSECPDGFSCTVTAYNRSYCCADRGKRFDKTRFRFWNSMLSIGAVCKQPKSSGIPCDDVIRDVDEEQRAWYYDSSTKRCQPMSYHGCDGNANRFHTLEACEQFCYPTLCPAGGRPLMNSGVVRPCWRDEDCSFGYRCSSSMSHSEPSVCCPSAGNHFLD